MERRLRDALVRLNPRPPISALDDALGKLTQLEGATLEDRNRSFHRMLVNHVPVEYQASDNSIRSEQARVVDFHATETNDWLVVNQFTVTENSNTRRPDIVLFLWRRRVVWCQLHPEVRSRATICFSQYTMVRRARQLETHRSIHISKTVLSTVKLGPTREASNQSFELSRGAQAHLEDRTIYRALRPT